MAGDGGLVPCVRIVVAGDGKTGKSSLIVAGTTKNFLSNVPPVLPPTRLPEHLYPAGCVPITIIDTSSSTEDQGQLVEELTSADGVILTYACDRPETIDNLRTYWLPELRRLEVRVPICVAGCMVDKRGVKQAARMNKVLDQMLLQFLEIETGINCSALYHKGISEVFNDAQKAVLHPSAPLYDKECDVLKPRYLRALKRIFILCDHDRDGALSDEEFNQFQSKCFNAHLRPSKIACYKRVVQEKLMEGVDHRGFTLEGFQILHCVFVDDLLMERAWTVLRKFGYNNEIRLRDDLLPPPIKRYPDQSVELTNEAVEFLRNIFIAYDVNCIGALSSSQIEDLFSTAPENPFNEAPYAEATGRTALGKLSLDVFISLWALMTLLDPIRSVENLIYIGYGGDPSSAIRVTRRRRLDRKKQQSERNVYQCFVFGPKESGKSALLNSFIRRPYPEKYAPTIGDRYVVDRLSELKKTLVLREIPEDGLEKFLSREEALSACDVAVFVYDSSRESSWKKANNMLISVARQGKATGYEVPCLVVAAKNDLHHCLTEVQDSTRDLGIEAPIPLSMKLGDSNNIFHRIVRAAEHPHLSICTGKIRKKYHHIVGFQHLFVSVGAAIVMAAFGAHMMDRKNSSRYRRHL
ncbi:hypothetical protein CASFOL_020580 [Castilleja foliolosa]|uniref:Mitochondrial Rho GTPase n=1 Tax=Castilleja foliolosa TaxID=1961234 RepID=A0ABD3D203_9LAMI